MNTNCILFRNTVSVIIDKSGNITFQHLSVHTIENVSDAMTLIKDGDFKRKMAETPMNIQSSRSHCICTIHLTRTSRHSSTIYSSKLNLVDLAGYVSPYKICRDRFERCNFYLSANYV